MVPLKIAFFCFQKYWSKCVLVIVFFIGVRGSYNMHEVIQNKCELFIVISFKMIQNDYNTLFIVKSI